MNTNINRRLTILKYRATICTLLGLCLLFAANPSHAEIIIEDILEIVQISNVTASEAVNLEQTYNSPVVVCTLLLRTDADNEGVVRVDSAAGSSFNVRVERPIDGNPDAPNDVTDITQSDVYCIIAEENAPSATYTLPNDSGTDLIFEARLRNVTVTNGSNNWNATTGEVTTDIAGAYSNPVVLGQVMTSNDMDFSVFWSYNCINRNQLAFTGVGSRLCVGKHVGQISNPSLASRANETVGYIVIESGRGSTGDFTYQPGITADTIRGVGTAPPYSTTTDESFDFAITTQMTQSGD